MTPASPALHIEVTDYKINTELQMLIKNQDIIYRELSYKIIGIAFDIFSELGHGHKEKYYQNAFAISFKKENIKFKQELYVPLIFRNENIGRYFLDFEVEDKIAIEIKRGERISHRDIEQLYSYLKGRKLKLGLIIRFTSKGAVIKRIVNIK